MNAPHALDRSLRLIREHISAGTEDAAILAALCGTRLLVYSDIHNARSHSAQTAIITTAMLAARCGLDVWLDIPNVPLMGPQPPLTGYLLRDALHGVSNDLIPGSTLHMGRPSRCDATAVLGNSGDVANEAGILLRMNATNWMGNLGGKPAAWAGSDCPFGAMAVGAMAACEAFKLAIYGLKSLATDPDAFDSLFQVSDTYRVRLAPDSLQPASDLGSVDVISAGAVTNGAMYALLRLTGIRGSFRIVEPQNYEPTNANRCMLMLASDIGTSKALAIARYETDRLRIAPSTETFQAAMDAGFSTLGSSVIVGVDDIPTRWDIQRSHAGWLGIGATTHWSAMASYHAPGLPCARCLHARNDGDPVEIAPTISFVSFWAGLWLSALLVMNRSGYSPVQQQIFLVPNNLHRRSGIWLSPVAWSSLCPYHRLTA